MTLRTFFVAAGLTGLVSMVPACGSSTDDSTSSSAAAFSGTTILKGSVASGEALTITYDPADYAGSELPFLGVRLIPAAQAAQAGEAPAAAVRTIQVTGQFPGSPNVVVVDNAFNVIATTKGVLTGNVAHAALQIPASADAQMVLVRDDLWVRPMPFTISAQ